MDKKVDDIVSFTDELQGFWAETCEIDVIYNEVKEDRKEYFRRLGYSEDELKLLQFQPKSIKGGILKPYQLKGMSWLSDLRQLDCNGILADQMGLGKTIQSLAYLALLKDRDKIRGPHLIVCPLSTVKNWVNEATKWLSGFRVVPLYARKEDREMVWTKYIRRREFDIIVTSYEGMLKNQKRLRRFKYQVLILDEAHKIKNMDTIFSKKLRELKIKSKTLLTGTPMQNNIMELFCLLNFTMPSIFNDNSLFNDWFREEEDTEKSKYSKEVLMEKLHKILNPFMLRRIKNDVNLDLPQKKEIVVKVPLNKLQLELYRNILLHKAPTEGSKTALGMILMQLRKVCLHPYLFDGVEKDNQETFGEHIVQSCSKLKILDKLLERLKGKHKILIFSQFTSMLDVLQDYCQLRGHSHRRLDGSTTSDDREDAIVEFSDTDKDVFIFLLSTRAGGLGINLTCADTVIIYDSDWNPQMDLQAMDRVHRIGQTKPVVVYRLINKNTVEEKIFERQQTKLKLDYLIVEKGRKISKLASALETEDELEDFIFFGVDNIFNTHKSKNDVNHLDEDDDDEDVNLDELLLRGEEDMNIRNQLLEQKFKEFNSQGL